MDGGAATAEIVGGPSATGRLVVTAYDTDVGIERAVEGGAIGYLVKGTTRDQLVRAIRSAARGETVLAPPGWRTGWRPGCGSPPRWC